MTRGGVTPDRAGAGLLRGRCILLTREDEGGVLPSRLRAAGATVRSVPLVRTLPVEDPEPLRDALRRLHEFEWVALTSSRAVEAVAMQTSSIADPAAAGLPSRVRWGCVGPLTARALREQLGFEADVVPEEFNAAALAEAILRAGIEGRLLFPAAEGARPDLPARLREECVEVHQVTAYRTVPAVLSPEDLDPPEGHDHWDAVALTSGTAVKVLIESLCRRLDADAARAWLRANGPAVLGRSAEATLRSAGVDPAFRAGQATTAELADAIIRGLSVVTG